MENVRKVMSIVGYQRQVVHQRCGGDKQVQLRSRATLIQQCSTYFAESSRDLLIDRQQVNVPKYQLKRLRMRRIRTGPENPGKQFTNANRRDCQSPAVLNKLFENAPISLEIGRDDVGIEQKPYAAGSERCCLRSRRMSARKRSSSSDASAHAPNASRRFFFEDIAGCNVTETCAPSGSPGDRSSSTILPRIVPLKIEPLFGMKSDCRLYLSVPVEATPSIRRSQ